MNTDEQNYSSGVYSLLTDPFIAAGIQAATLKAIGCQIVICLSHLGMAYDYYGLSGVPNIDIIVGGHSHDALETPIIAGGKIIVQSGEFGKFLGELKVNYTGSGVDLVSYRLLPADKSVRKDPALLPFLNALREGIVMDPRFGPVFTKHIATASWDLEERWQNPETNPHRDTALGNLVADAIKFGITKVGFPVAVGLEANGYIGHKIYKGKVVGNDIMRAVPYGYDETSGLGFKMKCALIPGIFILAGLEYSVSMVEFTDDISMQVSGLTFEYDSSATVPNPWLPFLTRLDPFSVKVNGELIFSDNLYTPFWIALNEQVYDVLESLLPSGSILAVIDTGLFEYNLVRDYMNKLNKLDYTSEGRIIDTAVQ